MFMHCAISKMAGESEQRRRNSQEEWWKIHEASMLALGSAQEVIESQIKAGKVQFDIGSFLQNVVLADLNSPVHPFLLGRCIWVGSKFPSSLPPQAILLEGTVRGPQVLRQSQITSDGT